MRVFLLGLLAFFSGTAWGEEPVAPQPVKEEVKKQYSESEFHLSTVEITERMYSRLPYLKPGYRFFDVYPGGNPGHGESHSLYVQAEEGKSWKITETRDLIPLVDKIETEEDALRYVRFLSNVSHDYFADVPFWELNPQMGALTIPKETWERHRLPPALPSQRSAPEGGQEFLIERYVLLKDQMKNLRPVDAQGEPLYTLSEIGKVTEVVSPRGEYRVELTRIPVEKFEVEFSPAAVD